MSTPASLETLLGEVVRNRGSAAAELARAELRRTAQAFFGIALEAEPGDPAAPAVRLLSLALADLLHTGAPAPAATRPGTSGPEEVAGATHPEGPAAVPTEQAAGPPPAEPEPVAAPAAADDAREAAEGTGETAPETGSAPAAAADPDPAPAPGGSGGGDEPRPGNPPPAPPPVAPDPAAALRDALLRLWDKHFTPVDQLRHDHVLGNRVRRCRPGTGPLPADRAAAELWDALHLALLRLPAAHDTAELRGLLADAAELPPTAGPGVPALPDGLRPAPGDDGGSAPGTALDLTDYRAHADGGSVFRGTAAPPFHGAPEPLGALLTSLHRDLKLLLPRDASLQYWWPRVTRLQAMTLTPFHPQAGQGTDFSAPAGTGGDVSRYFEQLRRSANRMRTTHGWQTAETDAAVELTELDAGLGGPVHSVPAGDTSWWGTRRRALTHETRTLLRKGGYGCAVREIGMSSASLPRTSVITADAGEPGTILWVVRHELLQGGGPVNHGVVVATGARGTKPPH
jgi:hypothetical protein